jgi:hypothetical protein
MEVQQGLKGVSKSELLLRTLMGGGLTGWETASSILARMEGQLTQQEVAIS